MTKRIVRTIDKYSILIMLVMGGIFYFMPGKWVSIEDDSNTYLYARGSEGVLPGYPVFLSVMKSFLGEKNFLSGVVVVQSLLAVFLTLLFVLVIQKQFKLRKCESVLLYAFCMLPFSIYLPETGVTHQILTEGITYAAFYLFIITVLKAVWTLKIRWYLAAVLVALFMGLFRSQMLYLQVVCIFLLIYLIYKKSSRRRMVKMLSVAAAFLTGIVLAIGAYKIIYAFVALDIQKQANLKTEDTLWEDESETTREATSQFDALIAIRGFYEVDEEDVILFEDEMMQDIFKRAYAIVDGEEKRYIYADPGLYMWEDLVYDRMKGKLIQAIEEYDNAYPGLRMRSESSIIRELSLRVLFKHFDRYIYHTIRLMLPSFIASVFFQIKPIYLLCHYITLFIYLLAAGGSLYLARNNGNRQVIEFMAVILITMILMVIIVNLIFVGLQRYVVYGMGIFYCAMYLLVKEMVKIICNRIKTMRLTSN